VALVGRAGAGKSYFASALAAALPLAQIIAVSDELRAQLHVEGVEATRSALADLGQSWIDRSPSTLAAAVLAHKRPDARVAIIDGVRHLEFLEALADYSGRAALAVVWIHTPTQVRHQRLIRGGTPREVIAALDEHPTERTIEQWVETRATWRVAGDTLVSEAVSELLVALRASLDLSGTNDKGNRGVEAGR
jgi:adenylate kinase family enzyme